MTDTTEYDDAIQHWIEQGEICIEMPDANDTIMGRGFCNGDCHACSELGKCAMDFYTETDMPMPITE